MSARGEIEKQVIEKIIHWIQELEFGAIQITVHDSQVTQIERLEKYRFPLEKKNSGKTTYISKSR